MIRIGMDPEGGTVNDTSLAADARTSSVKPESCAPQAWQGSRISGNINTITIQLIILRMVIPPIENCCVSVSGPLRADTFKRHINVINIIIFCFSKTNETFRF
jgi:hypothetical protein